MFETWQDIVFQNAFFNLVITNEGFWICFELEVLKVQLTEFLKFEMTTSEYQFIHAGPDTDEIKFIYKQNNDKLLIGYSSCKSDVWFGPNHLRARAHICSKRWRTLIYQAGIANDWQFCDDIEILPDVSPERTSWSLFHSFFVSPQRACPQTILC